MTFKLILFSQFSIIVFIVFQLSISAQSFDRLGSNNGSKTLVQLGTTLPPPKTILPESKIETNTNKVFPAVTDKNDRFQAPSNLKALGGGSDGGAFKFRYTSIPHYMHNRKQLMNVILNTDPRIIEDFGTQFGITLKAKDLYKVFDTMTALPSRNYAQVNPEGIEEPLVMTYDPIAKKIFALQPLFDFFNKKNLTAEEDGEMIQFFLHEASHLWDIGINKDDEKSIAFASQFYEKIVKGYDGACGLRGTVDEKFKSCNSVSVGDWKLISFSKSFGSLFLNEKLGYWVSNSRALVTSGSHVDNFPEICARVGAYFGVPLSLPSSNKLKFIFSTEPVFKKELGFERIYDYIQQHPESMPADARKAWKYLTPDKECFATENVKHSVCKNGEEVINSIDKFNGESIVCLHQQ